MNARMRGFASAMYALAVFVGGCTPAAQIPPLIGRQFEATITGNDGGAKIVVAIRTVALNQRPLRPESIGAQEVNAFSQTIADWMASEALPVDVRKRASGDPAYRVALDYAEVEDMHLGAAGTKGFLSGALTLGLANGFVTNPYDFESQITALVVRSDAGLPPHSAAARRE